MSARGRSVGLVGLVGELGVFGASTRGPVVAALYSDSHF